MATTIVPQNLTVTISESYTLNGVDYGNSPSTSFTTNGQVSQRIMNIATGDAETSVILFSTADAAGTVVKANYQYFRITNLDDTNFLRLEVTSGDTFYIKVKAGESFILMDNEMDAIASSTTFGAFADVTAINASADTAAIDIEFVCVTK